MTSAPCYAISVPLAATRSPNFTPGFEDVCIAGFQRYPLNNHIYWLSRHKPGGHNAWPLLNSVEMERAYGSVLASCDKTDTLLLTARKPSL
jgi:hypothetical protein